MLSLFVKSHFLPSRHLHAKGFALIATLTLMLLLCLISVGLLSLAASQNRTAAAAILAAEARSQALLGLDAALAELQLALGPDQRVSASSGIVGAHNTNILGAWNSWDASLTDKSPAHGGDIKSTYTKGRDKMFRRWLISAVNKADIDKLGNIGSLGTRKPGKRICLVGEGTLGRGIPQQQYIYADLIDTPASGGHTGRFAWWAGGENQKAKITIDKPENSRDAMETLRRTWDTPRPVVGHIRGLEGLPGGAAQRLKFLSTASLPLGRRTSADAGRPYFFDITTSSMSLPVNVRSGGFKHDLNLLLNKETLRNTEFARLPQSDCPIFNENTIQRGSEPNMPIGSWQLLHAWYHMWPGGGSSNVNDELSVSLLGTPGNAFTRLGGSSLSGQDNCSYFDNKTDIETGGGKAGYPRTPVMLAFYNTFGLFTELLNPANTDPNKETFYKLGMSFAPMILWWNPYNVPMKIKGDMLYTQSIPYKSMWLQSYSISQTNTWNYRWGVYGIGSSSQDAAEKGFGKDYGNYFRATQNGSGEDIVFEPGEILFFSPAKARSVEEYTQPGSNPWTLGYHPEAVAGYKAHFYGNMNTQYGTSDTNVAAGKFYVKLRLGIHDGSGSWDTDGHYFAPNRPEALSLLCGYGGISVASSYHLGKMVQSPQRFTLGWYDPDAQPQNSVICRGTQDDAVWQAGQTQMNRHVPYYLVAVGIAPKTGAPSLDSYMFPDRDFRTKSWQHSSPAFWGSMIVNPDDQTRRYHPYQLSVLPAGTGMSMCPLDSTGDGGRNGFLGISLAAGGEQVSFASVLELPVHPPFSLAGFAGMRLTPGWFDSGSSELPALRRQQYQSGVPGVGIGNSFADPCIAPGAVYQHHELNIPAISGSCSQIFEDFFDHGFLVNDALWDRFFCSSISDMPRAAGGGVKKARETLQEFIGGISPLPVSRYRLTAEPMARDEMIGRILADDGWKKVARYLLIDGGFNVNSTSVDAWQAVLQGLQNRRLAARQAGTLATVGNDSTEMARSVFFSRFGVSTTTKSIDSVGGYNPMTGGNFRASGSQATAWSELRELSPAQIRQLAEAMVIIVKKRGPFLNMADFVNRRLDPSNEDDSLCGALQAAIDATPFNSSLFNVKTPALPAGNLFVFPKADEGSIHAAAPGYLIQSDVLASLGNVLTVRDDTFIVRSYGNVCDARGRVLSQAWCEATVQRCVEYVDRANAPEDLPSASTTASVQQGTRLTAVNTVFGRRLCVVSRKWLSAMDI